VAKIVNTIFWGTQRGVIDANGRVILPAEWRQMLGGNLIITRGIERCLLMFSLPKFRTIVAAIDKLGFELSDARKWGRYLAGMASEAAIDPEGSVSIPSGLKDFAGLTSTVVLVGVVDHVEIWDDHKYGACVSALESEMPDVTERIGKLKQGRTV
jgi:MraZ protein